MEPRMIGDGLDDFLRRLAWACIEKHPDDSQGAVDFLAGMERDDDEMDDAA